MDSIRQVFSYRLREKRGALTQEVFSARLGIPLRTYQKMEAGNIPQKETLLRVVAKLDLESETALFADPELGHAKLRLLEWIASLEDLPAEELLALLKAMEADGEMPASLSSNRLKPYPVAKNSRKS